MLGNYVNGRTECAADGTAHTHVYARSPEKIMGDQGEKPGDSCRDCRVHGCARNCDRQRERSKSARLRRHNLGLLAETEDGWVTAAYIVGKGGIRPGKWYGIVNGEVRCLET